MPILETSIDTESDEYKANYGAMERLVADLQAELSKARDERSQKSRDRLAQTGKLSVQKKLDLLLDRNTPFLEIGALAAKDMYDGKIHQAGVRAGVGIIQGRECLISANDTTIKGGSVYPMGVKKSLRLQTIAMENRLPFVSLMDSAGAYLPMQSEIFPMRTTAAAFSTTRRACPRWGFPRSPPSWGCAPPAAPTVWPCPTKSYTSRDTGRSFWEGRPW
jgi:acetyl-CoA carboxylase carboxyltransferase component